jgi:hypothetical protein
MEARSRSRLLAAALAAIVVGGGGRSARADVEAEKQALVMLRVLAYDHALASRSGPTVRLAVVHGESAASLSCAGRMRAVFERLVKRVVVTGKRLEVDTIAVAQLTEQTLAGRRVSVLYVCRGSERDVPLIAKAARAAQALSFTDQETYLQLGLSIALSAGETKIGISVNLVAARAEGARLAGQLLQLSKVVSR